MDAAGLIRVISGKKGGGDSTSEVRVSGRRHPILTFLL